MKRLVGRLASTHKLVLFLMMTIAMAAILVAVSMNIYYTSNAFRLDLSRPEYKQVRSQIAKESKADSLYPAQGSIDKDSLDDFLGRYRQEEAKIVDAKAYQVDTLSDEQLGLSSGASPAN